MHPRHEPRANLMRGVLLLYKCRCGRTAVTDPSSGRAWHVTIAGWDKRTIPADNIADGVDKFPGQ